MDFGKLLRHVSVMNFKLTLSRPFNIQGKGPYLCDLIKNKQTKKQTNKQTPNKQQCNVGLYSEICRPIFLNMVG